MSAHYPPYPPSGSVLIKYRDATDYSKWLSASVPFICVETHDSPNGNTECDYNVYYILTTSRAMLNGEKCFVNDVKNNIRDVDKTMLDNRHLSIYLGHVSYSLKAHAEFNSSENFNSNVSGTWSYQFIEFY